MNYFNLTFVVAIHLHHRFQVVMSRHIGRDLKQLACFYIYKRHAASVAIKIFSSFEVGQATSGFSLHTFVYTQNKSRGVNLFFSRDQFHQKSNKRSSSSFRFSQLVALTKRSSVLLNKLQGTTKEMLLREAGRSAQFYLICIRIALQDS